MKCVGTPVTCEVRLSDGTCLAGCRLHQKRVTELERKLDEALKCLALRDAGIKDALAATTVEAMRAPLIGCTMKPVQITDVDRKWAEGSVGEGGA